MKSFTSLWSLLSFILSLIVISTLALTNNIHAQDKVINKDIELLPTPKQELPQKTQKDKII